MSLQGRREYLLECSKERRFLANCESSSVTSTKEPIKNKPKKKAKKRVSKTITNFKKGSRVRLVKYEGRKKISEDDRRVAYARNGEVFIAPINSAGGKVDQWLPTFTQEGKQIGDHVNGLVCKYKIFKDN